MYYSVTSFSINKLLKWVYNFALVLQLLSIKNVEIARDLFIYSDSQSAIQSDMW